MEIVATNAAMVDAIAQLLMIVSVELFVVKETLSARVMFAMIQMLLHAFPDTIPLLMYYVVKDLKLVEVVIVSKFYENSTKHLLQFSRIF